MFSKTVSLRSDRANASDGRAMNHFDRDAEDSLSAFDQTHSFKLNFSYELPFGPDRPFLNDGVLSKIVGGWRVSGVQSYASGFPRAVTPGYNLPLFGGDNRLTVLDDTGWRAPTTGTTSIRSSISGGIRLCSTPPRSTRSVSYRDIRPAC